MHVTIYICDKLLLNKSKLNNANKKKQKHTPALIIQSNPDCILCYIRELMLVTVFKLSKRYSTINTLISIQIFLIFSAIDQTTHQDITKFLMGYYF